MNMYVFPYRKVLAAWQCVGACSSAILDSTRHANSIASHHTKSYLLYWTITARLQT